MAQKVITESFDSLYELLYEVDTRPKNAVMQQENSSHTGGFEFGAILTRSSFLSNAISCARVFGTTPT